jgi:predicted regulator of Ras-like GTPase activity (Roadblock/LC7/MglB family)
MATIEYSLQELMKIDGAIGCCLVDYESGMVLGKAGGGLDLDLAAAGNTEVVRAKMKTAKSLNLKDKIEDILITLSTQLHIIRPTAQHDGLFIYLALDKEKANLALARRKCLGVEKDLEL